MLRTSINQGVRQINRNMSQIKCKRLEGRTAIITASTDGIGFAIAKRLAEEGARVIISSRKESNVKKAVEQLKSEGLSVSGITCHVGKREDREGLLKKAEQEFGVLDILVSNAGINPGAGPLFETTEEIWDKIFDINVKSSFLLIKEFLPLLRKSKFPSIIIMSSVSAYKPLSVLGAYGVSKTALVGLTQAAASSLASEGIRVNCVAPGIIKTKFSRILYEDGAEQATLSMIPMQKFGTSNDIAGITSFLASDDAAYITGETILATGGMQCRL